MNIHSMAYVEMLMRMRAGKKVRRNKNLAPGIYASALGFRQVSS